MAYQSATLWISTIVPDQNWTSIMYLIHDDSKYGQNKEAQNL